ncbi:hypothetical protein L1887_36920 [Cichorium endivia]|nr:hypothetical protein L1887_36920 [Cichorium endivia]
MEEKGVMKCNTWLCCSRDKVNYLFVGVYRPVEYWKPNQNKILKHPYKRNNIAGYPFSLQAWEKNSHMDFEYVGF